MSRHLFQHFSTQALHLYAFDYYSWKSKKLTTLNISYRFSIRFVVNPTTKLQIKIQKYLASVFVWKGTPSFQSKQIFWEHFFSAWSLTISCPLNLWLYPLPLSRWVLCSGCLYEPACICTICVPEILFTKILTINFDLTYVIVLFHKNCYENTSV